MASSIFLPTHPSEFSVVQRAPSTANRSRFGGVSRFIVCLFGILLLARIAPGQELAASSLPEAPSPQVQEQTAQPQSPNPLQSGVALIQLLQQKSLVFPDIATGQGPLSSWGKFQLAADNSISVSAIGTSIIGAGFSQAINRPSGYGQGAEGFAKRFGANMARNASDNLFGTFLLASALHQDPRFFVEENLSFRESIRYAAVRVFITRSDAGRRVPNYSGLLSPALAEGLANVYYPDENRSAGETLSRYGSDIAWRFAGNLARQYWPVLNRRLGIAPVKTAP